MLSLQQRESQVRTVADRALLEQVAPSPEFKTYTYPVHDQAPSVQLALGDAPLSLVTAPVHPSRRSSQQTAAPVEATPPSW